MFAIAWSIFVKIDNVFSRVLGEGTGGTPRHLVALPKGAAQLTGEVNVKRIPAPTSRRFGMALVVSALALGLATTACSSERTSDAAAPTAPASDATSPDLTTPESPKPVEAAVPTAGGPAFARGGSTNCDNGYTGVWLAKDPKAFIASVTISQTDCDRLNTARFRIVSRPWLGLGSDYVDWGYAKNISWGYLGTSVTVTYYFTSGLVEKVRILPSLDGSGLRTDGREIYTDGTSSTLATETYGRYGR